TPLGETAADDAQRDAVHVAIFPATSDHQLYPGLRVKLVAGAHDKVEPAHDGAIGIVDPFLFSAVMPGTRFYVCLMPNTVTGMRHHWEHPLVSDKVATDSLAPTDADKALINQ